MHILPMNLPARHWRAAAACLALLGGTAARGATPFPLGVYVGNPNDDDQAQEAQFEADFNAFASTLNATPTLYDSYIDFTQPIEDWAGNSGWDAGSHANSPVARNLQPVIGFPMYSIATGSPAPDEQFQAFAAGQYDSIINSIVQVWVQNGVTNLIFRVGWEMNLNGTPYYVGSDAQSQADWVAAFRHISLVLKQAGTAYGATISVVWNPGATNWSDASATNSLWPGDRYVDMVGIDMYGDMYPYADTQNPALYHDWDTGLEDTSVTQFIADPVNRHHYWTWPAADQWAKNASQGHSETFLALTHFAIHHAKPIAICETGAGNSNSGQDVADDPTFPAWLSQALRKTVTEGGSIAFVNIWDSNGGGNYEFSYATDGKPLEAASWRHRFGH